MIIYKTTNLINGKIYIGKDTKNDSKYYGSGNLLKKAIIKYGKKNFIKEILEHCVDMEDLANKERYWIKELDSKNKKIGYNIADGGDGGDTISNHPNRKEIIEKSTKSRIGLPAWNKGLTNIYSDDTLTKMSESKKILTPWHKGLVGVYSEETLEKFRQAKIGKKASKETKDKMSNAKMGGISGMKGKIHTEESKNKTSKSLEKKVLRIINGEINNIWESPKEASKELNLSIKMIRYFCRKKDINNKHGLIYNVDYEKTK